MKLRSIFNLIILSLLLSAGPLGGLAQNAPFPDFDDYVNKAMKDWDVPGMAIAIVKDDKIVYAKGYGLRELDKTAAVDENTIFFTCDAIMAFNNDRLPATLLVK